MREMKMRFLSGTIVAQGRKPLLNINDDETPYLPKTINDLIPKKVYEPQQDRRYDTPQRRVPDGSNEPYVAPTLSDIIKGGR